MSRIEDAILSNLLVSDEFSRAAIPFVKQEYFQDKTEGILFSEISAFFNKHNKPITKEILGIELRNLTGISDTELSNAEAKVNELSSEPTNFDWLIEKTEEFCKKRSIYLAILQSITILDGKEKTNLSEDAIPKLLQEALNVSFDITVGHNYLIDAAERFDLYSLKEDKIPFDIDKLNEATKGGMSRKALYCVGAISGGGKSIFMTHTAASTLKQGKNVLYITLEMSEERIAERIDANLLNIAVDSIKGMSKDDFVTKIDKVASKTHGKLYIKEYPTGGAHTGHFRGLLEELKTKQNFIPDLVVVDYLGICASSRMKMGGTVNSYSFIKSVAEELRGLAVEYNIAILTGAQLNRSGYEASDVDLSNTADSMGLVMTLDFFFALIATEELNDLNQVIMKIMKNRYGELTKFIAGLDKPRMKFYSVEDSAQTLSSPAAAVAKGGFKKAEKDVPAFDSTRTGRAIAASGFKF